MAPSPPPVIARPDVTRHERRTADGLRTGDPEALAALYSDLGRPVFGYLVAALPDRGTAEDVFQRVFAEVWQRGDQYDPARASLLTWVMTIARSRAIDELRRRRPEPIDPADVPDRSEPAHEDALHDRWRMARLLALLPGDEAALLRLRFYEERSQSEIAEATGIPLGTVKTRMVRGLERLRDLMEAEERRSHIAAAPLGAPAPGVPSSPGVTA